jgi:hypothetical protein
MANALREFLLHALFITENDFFSTFVTLPFSPVLCTVAQSSSGFSIFFGSFGRPLFPVGAMGTSLL